MGKGNIPRLHLFAFETIYNKRPKIMKPWCLGRASCDVDREYTDATGAFGR